MTQYHVRTTIQDQKRLFINYRLQHPAYSDNVVVFQLLSCIHLFAAPWTVARQPSLSFTISLSLFNFVSIESAVPSNHLILCYPLLTLRSVFPSIRVFSSGSVLTTGGQSIGASTSVQWISFRIDWFDLLAVHRTLKSLLQHHSWKALVLLWSAFFMVQHSDPYMTTRKTIALTIWTSVCKVMCLLFNMLSQFVNIPLVGFKTIPGPGLEPDIESLLQEVSVDKMNWLLLS